MAEFLVHRDQLQRSTSLVLKKDSPTYGDERPFNDACLDCPIKNTRIAGGCTTLGYNSYTKDVRATLPTNVGSQCGIIKDPNHIVILGNDDYDSLMAAYTDKKNFIAARDQVREALRKLLPEDQHS